MGISAAVNEARRLDEIKFPEFTAQLVNSTFDALVSANLKQTESYLQLTQAIAKTCSTYVNDTKDDISGEMVLQFYTAVLKKDPTSTIKVGVALVAGEVTSLNTALMLPSAEGGMTGASNSFLDNQAASTTVLTQTTLDTLNEAVARRLAANKYDLLKQMVKMGLLRLIVEKGTIETRLTFNTYANSYYQSSASQYHRSDFNVRANASTGGALSAWVRASASTSYTSVNVSTASQYQRDMSGSSVQIFGRVELQFRTDYMPLNT